MKKEVIMSAFLGLACTGILLSSCSENNDDPSSKPDRTTTDEMYYANQFARDMLETYYYWNKEIAGDLPLLDPETNNDPITTVDQIKYHEGDKVIDKWTCSPMTSKVLPAALKELQQPTATCPSLTF